MTIAKPLTVKDILTDKRFTRSALPSIELVAESIAGEREKIKLVYGETYDTYGLTIDSLKYYFYIALLRELIRNKGLEASATIIIGDVHSVRNKLVRDKDGLLAQAEERLRFIRKIDDIYKLRCSPVVMSELLADATVQKRLAAIQPIFEDSQELQDIAKQSVLANRLKQEAEAGFQYTLEEVALIIGFDIKIGPPREIHYDRLAVQLGPKIGQYGFDSIYLSPTYPLGLGFDYFVTHPEIEVYGLTPYKAGSNRLEKYRIILGVTSLEQARRLIDSSFISTNPDLPNPTLDIYLISKLAGHFLHGESLEVDEALMKDTEAFKRATYEGLKDNIYEPMGLAP